jgi:DNA-binding NtrC family response regulator
LEEQKRILVVDDDDAILKSVATILQLKGYNVDTAETGRQAIEKSQAHFFNLALLDIKLPDMEGTSLLVKMHQTTPRMMKIMLTGYPSLENAVTALNLGADAYVLKPVNPKDLLKVVEEKLAEQSEAEALSEEKVAEWVRTRLRKAQQEDGSE